jgi:two-component system, OmpR family, response regulator
MNKIKVLVVDDEEIFLKTVVERLESRGFNVQGVTSGKDCLDLMSRESFEVVVLDFKMASISGLDVLREIKQKWPETQVVMLTGHASAETGIEGLSLGAFDYLIKPAPVEELVRKIYQAAESRSARMLNR